ncbi:hypothetical protein, partial [Streptomyces vinaceus]|uniref:hypothetical protein n=1 Tax=Streptomyces vinaceus TaxID=1960 RepID=UPI0036CAF9A7
MPLAGGRGGREQTGGGEPEGRVEQPPREQEPFGVAGGQGQQPRGEDECGRQRRRPAEVQGLGDEQERAVSLQIRVARAEQNTPTTAEP